MCSLFCLPGLVIVTFSKVSKLEFLPINKTVESFKTFNEDELSKFKLGRLLFVIVSIVLVFIEIFSILTLDKLVILLLVTFNVLKSKFSILVIKFCDRLSSSNCSKFFTKSILLILLFCKFNTLSFGVFTSCKDVIALLLASNVSKLGKFNPDNELIPVLVIFNFFKLISLLSPLPITFELRILSVKSSACKLGKFKPSTVVILLLVKFNSNNICILLNKDISLITLLDKFNVFTLPFITSVLIWLISLLDKSKFSKFVHCILAILLIPLLDKFTFFTLCKFIFKLGI